MNNNGWLSVEYHPPPVKQFVQVFVDHTINRQTKLIKEMLGAPLQYVTVAQVYCYDTYNEREWSEYSVPRWMLCIVGGGPMGQFEDITHWKPLEENWPNSAYHSTLNEVAQV